MQPKNNEPDNGNQQPKVKNNDPASSENTKSAHEQADADIEKDADFMPGNEADDLDEAESVKLNDDENDLV